MDNDLSINNTEKVKDKECKTCKERMYKDKLNDPGVSFKTPGNIAPEDSARVVMAHEMEHVKNESLEAQKTDREILYQSVSLKTAVCPECGKSYVSGGETKTVSRAKNNDDKKDDFFINKHKEFLNNHFGSKIDTKI